MLIVSDVVLAAIADAYIPLLLIVALVNIFLCWREGDNLRGLYLIYCVGIVYGCMFADICFRLWPTYGLDFSTHTAASLALVVFISMDKFFVFKIILTASLFAYGCLMFLLQYHTWSDMISTAIVIGVFLTPIVVTRKRIDKHHCAMQNT